MKLAFSLLYTYRLDDMKLAFSLLYTRVRVVPCFVPQCKIISLFYNISHVTTSETEIKLFQPLKEF